MKSYVESGGAAPVSSASGQMTHGCGGHWTQANTLPVGLLQDLNETAL